MSTTSLGITGSTGVVGGQVSAQVAAAGRSMRLIVRDPSRAPAYDGAEVRQASYGDQRASLAALTGVRLLFMVSAAESATRRAEHVAFVDAAAEAGVRHVVYTSFYGASPTATFTLGRDHAATEERIRESGMSFTFLRDNLYADYLPFFAGEEGVIRGPARDGRLAAVAQQDVAAVATAVLLDPAAHVNATYHLTGPESLSLDEAAQTIADVTGKPVRYHAETLEEAYESRAAYGAEPWQVEAWVSTYTAIAQGEMDGVSPDVERILGRPPISLEELLRAKA